MMIVPSLSTLASTYLFFLSLISLCLAGSPSPLPGPSLQDSVCLRIAHSISPASEVFYPGESLYEKGIFHWASSSTQQSKCVVEAGTPSDVGIILVILGQTRTPFAVKSGGHATNPGFSSTSDIHISLYRFSEVNYNSTSNTADVGTGLIWDDVYAALESFGVNVLGGRVSGIGVGGFLLGGGYSWMTNQYGLAIDNVVAFELVQPNGKTVIVTNSSDPELFFGLKGGMNNFGIVTKFTLKTHPQSLVWGGSILNLESTLSDVEAATIAFQAAVTDPKAGLIMTYNYVPSIQQILINQLMFYDGPTPPAGIFDTLLAIPATSSDVSTRSMLSLVRASPSNGTDGARAVFQGYPIASLTSSISAVIVNETRFWGTALANKSAVTVSYAMELFLPSIYSHNPDNTAFPPSRNLFFQPFDLEFDVDFHAAARASSAHIREAAIGEGQSELVDAPIYPNYAISGTPLADMYGGNVPALQALKRRIDPQNVMGLAGGWKF
ncbi:hypothetical protein HYPSUDRAFT_70899 [Hypholoma sublateritium FD-334 SS-4]|uniref:FAD-binding PCMH-type domain-containing protein n=1 Tax=Hypholoma sublateritium (strain FD-334 SS-4) TaxID=945553 RepID=A0A0D2M207_HYPSF|nr:hypothetical protein HYPSUDRAFT_70899 [Hypholoma sublateritium FD-334 SS-4]